MVKVKTKRDKEKVDISINLALIKRIITSGENGRLTQDTLTRKVVIHNHMSNEDLKNLAGWIIKRDAAKAVEKAKESEANKK